MGLITTLTRYIFIILIILIFFHLLRWRKVKSKTILTKSHHSKQNQHIYKRANIMVQDPQCGLYLTRYEALSIQTHYKQLFFCCHECYNAYITDLKSNINN